MPWRIDFLATAPADDPTSGLSRAIWQLGRSLTERGHAVRVLYPSPSLAAPVPVGAVVPVPVPVLKVPRRPFGRDILVGRNASALVDRHADLLIGNDEKAGALDSGLLTPGNGPAFGLFVHDVALHTFDTLRPLQAPAGLRQRIGNRLDRRTLQRLEGRALARARIVVVGSELNRQLLDRYYHVPPERIRHLPHGVPDPLDVGSREAARQALRIPLDVPVALFVGRNPERQGLATALEAFRRVRRFFPGARLIVIGSTAAAEPGVLSLGVVDEPTKARAYRAADVLLAPSRYEGFGLAPREAMRYGVAAIISHHIPREGIPAPSAWRVPADEEPGSYASELAELFADPALRRSVAEAGRQCADELSYAKMAERFEMIFQPIVRARAG